MAQIAVPLLLVLLVGFFCQDAAAFRCCRRYSKREVSFTHIRGYAIQTIKRNCNIDAVIFYTSSGRCVCADPSQAWVIRILNESVKTPSSSWKKQQRRN